MSSSFLPGPCRVSTVTGSCQALLADLQRFSFTPCCPLKKSYGHTDKETERERKQRHSVRLVSLGPPGGRM